MAESRRNMVVIVCDELRPDFLKAYGADFIPTPNIDALAEHGVVFDNAITAATVCGPARAAILTGCHVSGHDSWTNTMPLKPGVERLPDRLNAAGYMTAAIGTHDHPDNGCRYRYRFGEDRPGSNYVAWLRQRHPEAVGCYAADPADPYHFAYTEEEHYDRWSCDRAIDFIRSYGLHHTVPDPAYLDGEIPKDAPFFLYCGFFMPHTPYLPPKEMQGRIDPAKLPEIWTTNRVDDIPMVERNRRAYLNPPEALADPACVFEERQKERVAYCEMICEVDDLVGRIVQTLKDCGLYENTTILFTSDHGSMENDYNMSTKGPWPYSPQMFVPMILSNHPGLRGRCDCLCGPIDTGATALELAGDDRAFGLSRSLIGQANGTVPERKTFLSEFCDSCKNILDKRYTFTYYPFTGETGLYDREVDPRMTANLGGNPAYADVERRFLMEVIDWMVLSKGVRIEAHDMVPVVRAGIEEKHPKFLDTFEIAYPIHTDEEKRRVRLAGLDPTYDDFCENRPVKAQYGVYAPEKKQ